MDSYSLHLPTTEGQHQLCPFRPPAHPALGPWAAPPAYSHPSGLGEALSVSLVALPPVGGRFPSVTEDLFGHSPVASDASL